MLLEGGPEGLLSAVVAEVANVQLDVRVAGGVEAPSSPPSASGGSLALGAALVHLEGPAVEVGPVHGGDGIVGGLLGVEGDEGEAPGIARVAVGGEEAVADRAELLEGCPEGVLGGVEGQVAHVELDGVLGGGGGGGGVVGRGGAGFAFVVGHDLGVVGVFSEGEIWFPRSFGRVARTIAGEGFGYCLHCYLLLLFIVWLALKCAVGG